MPRCFPAVGFMKWVKQSESMPILFHRLRSRIGDIFLKKRYDTESTYAEAYSFCTQDLTEKASANQTLKTTAEESAIHMVEALLKPFEPHLEEGQTFQILFEADWEEGQK